jgi:UDPglucose--hexose-1-phosphate uridylyltransferase
MGFHQAPTDGCGHDEWHFHGHFLPPLLRSATVRKYMVGFELLGMPQRDITPEAAAARLQGVAGVHFLGRV